MKDTASAPMTQGEMGWVSEVVILPDAISGDSVMEMFSRQSCELVGLANIG
jgi:hypothetical protein